MLSSNVLYILNFIAYLGLVVLLVFICFQTKSKGLILISAILLAGGILDWGFEQIGKLYVDRLIVSEMGGEGTQNVSVGEFLITLTLIQHLLYGCLCLLGGFLIYREWQHGKFRNPQPEHLKESMA